MITKTEKRNKAKELELNKPVKDLIKLIELDYKILNKLEVLIFLKDDVLALNKRYTQKRMAKVFRYTEPTYSTICKCLEALDILSIGVIEDSIEILYNNESYLISRVK